MSWALLLDIMFFYFGGFAFESWHDSRSMTLIQPQCGHDIINRKTTAASFSRLPAAVRHFLTAGPKRMTPSSNMHLCAQSSSPGGKRASEVTQMDWRWPELEDEGRENKFVSSVAEAGVALYTHLAGRDTPIRVIWPFHDLLSAATPLYYDRASYSLTSGNGLSH